MSSPDPSRPSLVERWFPLRQRITLTVYLALALAFLVSLGAAYSIQATRGRVDALVRLVGAAESVRAYRTAVDDMQFAAYRFVASNHESAAGRVIRTHTRTRASITACIATRCAGEDANARLAELLARLDSFQQAFMEVIRQRRTLEETIEVRLENALGQARTALPQPGEGAKDPGKEQIRLLHRHLDSVERSAKAMLYAAALVPDTSRGFYFRAARDALARVSTEDLARPRETVANALADMEATHRELVQRSRGYLFLVNVVMAADTHEVQVLADRLEGQLAGKIARGRAVLDHSLGRFAVALVVLLAAGSALILVVGRVMAGSVTGQIRTLTRTFAELTAGSEAPVTSRSAHKDEIGELTRAAERFRDQNAAVHDLLQRYKALNEDLESRISERTHALRESNRELERVANTDPLTGVWNRRALDGAIRRELTRCRRYQHSCAVLFMDTDHFKEVNDRHGHEEGDRVLARLAREVVGFLRESDLFGRWGGEEFLAFSPETGPEDMLRLAERLRAFVAGLDFSPVGQVTVSIGIAGLAPEDTEQSLIQRADRALYKAKVQGRNRCVLAPQPPDSSTT